MRWFGRTNRVGLLRVFRSATNSMSKTVCSGYRGGRHALGLIPLPVPPLSASVDVSADLSGVGAAGEPVRLSGCWIGVYLDARCRGAEPLDELTIVKVSIQSGRGAIQRRGLADRTWLLGSANVSRPSSRAADLCLMEADLRLFGDLEENDSSQFGCSRTSTKRTVGFHEHLSLPPRGCPARTR